MKRLRHCLFNFAAAVSLGMCVAIAVLWVRSFFVSDGVGYQRTDAPQRTWKQFWVESNPGRLFFGGTARVFDANGQVEAYVLEQAIPDGWLFTSSSEPTVKGGFWRRLGFAVHRTIIRRQGAATIDGLTGTVPYWFLLLASAILPGGWIRSWRFRRDIRRRGLCPVCGYDLRATPDRCPECGAIPPAAKGSAT